MRSRAKVYVKKRDAAAARGSEDRQSTGKGTKRHKENEIEKVCSPSPLHFRIRYS